MPLCLLIYVRCVPSLIFRLLERPSWACKLLSVPSWSAPHNKGGFKGQKVSRLLIVLFDFFLSNFPKFAFCNFRQTIWCMIASPIDHFKLKAVQHAYCQFDEIWRNWTRLFHCLYSQCLFLLLQCCSST